MMARTAARVSTTSTCTSSGAVFSDGPRASRRGARILGDGHKRRRKETGVKRECVSAGLRRGSLFRARSSVLRRSCCFLVWFLYHSCCESSVFLRQHHVPVSCRCVRVYVTQDFRWATVRGDVRRGAAAWQNGARTMCCPTKRSLPQRVASCPLAAKPIRHGRRGTRGKQE